MVRFERAEIHARNAPTPLMNARSMLRQHAVAASALALAAVAAAPRTAAAQTDYYNTDRGRPVEIEDAYPTEYRGLEIKAAPVRLERMAGVYVWGIEPELAAGVLPRTQLEIGAPVAFVDSRSARRTSGLTGIEASLLYEFNVETRLPALALAADALLPVGGLAAERTFVSAKAIATKTLRGARFHVNARYTFGSEPASPAGAGQLELSRWLTGAAVDHAFPLQALLVTAELYARQPIVAAEAVDWNAGAGARYQVTPRWAIDVGAGRRIGGDVGAWHLTFGTAYALGFPWH